MPSPADSFARASALIDAAHAEDPKGEQPVYAQQMSRWLDVLEPDASVALRLAARAQHIRRWHIPRDSFPQDRAGYLAWRKKLYGFHAEQAAMLLREADCDDATISKVESLLRKEKLKLDPEMQTLEDVICLVFLENYFGEFRKDKDEAKLINILRRTWAKMSPRGREAALTIKLGDQEAALVTKALT